MGKLLRSPNIDRILAVFMAVILWLFVTGDNITRTTAVRKIIQDVPLSYEYLQPGLAVVKMPPTVDMTLEGVPGAFDELLENELEAYLDLSELGAGTHQVQVRGKAPRGLTVISLAPQQVEVSIEELHTALFPVEVEFYGVPAAGWVKQDHSCQPPQVSLEAVPSVLKQIERVIIRIDLTNRRDHFKTEIAPLLLDASGEAISGVVVKPPKVSVTVNLTKKNNNNTVKNGILSP